MNKLLKIQGLGVYTLLNYLDKGLTFIIPLLVLRLFPDNYIYADLEYLISVTLIVSSFLDFGLRTYLFYGYRTSGHREYFCGMARNALLALTVFYILLGIVIFAVSGFNEFILFCLARIIFLAFTNVQSTIYRLEDKPTNIFLYLTTASIVIGLTVVVTYLSGYPYSLLLYSMPYILFCAGVLFSAARKAAHLKKHLPVVRTLFLKSLIYGWPIVLIQLVNAFQNNFAKVYGYNRIAMDEFQTLAVMLRCFTIVVLSYSAAQAFYQKRIFTSHGSLRSTYPKYMGACLFGFLLMFVFIFLSNRFDFLIPIPMDMNLAILTVTYLTLINRAYIEQYFSKHNKLRLPLMATVMGFGSFAALLAVLSFSGRLTITLVLFSLMVSELVNFSFIIYKFITVVRKLEFADEKK